VVVGAGAAGLMAAIVAAGQAAPVLVLETTPDGGRKILISGGGRCNVLPSRLDPRQYTTASSPNTLRNIFRSWPVEEQRRFFEDGLGLPLALEEETGKLFPLSNSARQVRDRLVAEAQRKGARFRFRARVTSLGPPASDDLWRVGLEDGTELAARSVILASGGLSVPATGSDGGGIRMAERLGHTVHDLYPALTPLTASPPPHAALAGVSVPVMLTAPGAGATAQARGGFLFTHRGYSGPAVLDISHHAVRSRLADGARQAIVVAWGCNDLEWWDGTLRTRTQATVGSVLRRHLPARLADTLLAEAVVAPDTPVAQLRREARSRLAGILGRYDLPWTGDEGYRKAEVTGGGVALAEIDPRTMESRIRPGLFLCGEILDAFGPIGGYNFAWAWATGRAAGLGAAAHAGTGASG
jgi:predicted Rossmann fold flavoprotein